MYHVGKQHDDKSSAMTDHFSYFIHLSEYPENLLPGRFQERKLNKEVYTNARVAAIDNRKPGRNISIVQQFTENSRYSNEEQGIPYIHAKTSLLDDLLLPGLNFTT